MANFLTSLIEKMGLSKSTVIDQAENILNANRDKIPDAVEGQIENALHGDMVGGVLDKLGIEGDVPTASGEKAPAEEASDEETTNEKGK